MGTTVRFDLPQQTQQFEQVQRRFPDIARLIEDVATADRRGPGMTRLLRPDVHAAMTAVMAAYPVLWKAACKVLPVLADPELAKVYAQFAWTYPKLEAAMAGVFEARRKNPNATVRSPLVNPVLLTQFVEAQMRFPELQGAFDSLAIDPVFKTRQALVRPEWIPVPPKPPKASLMKPVVDVFPPAGPNRPFLRCGERFALREREAGRYLVSNPANPVGPPILSEVPATEWEFHHQNGGDVITSLNVRYALFNRTISRYLQANPGATPFLEWVANPQNLIEFWRIVGELPSDISLRVRGPVRLEIGLAGLGIGLRLVFDAAQQILVLGSSSQPNWICVRQATVDELPSLMPCLGDFSPGESEYSDDRPETWMLQETGAPFLTSGAYRTIQRAPYIQDLSARSVVICWRLAVPSASLNKFIWLLNTSDIPVTLADRFSDFPAELKQMLDFHVHLAPSWIDFDSSDDSIQVKGSEHLATLHVCNSDYISAGANRPQIEFRMRFDGLLPETLYHYRIRGSVLPAEGFKVGKEQNSTKDTLIAADVRFKTAAERPLLNKPSSPLTFIAVGDLGPGNDRPNFVYDVADVLHQVARDTGTQLWLALGDIDNRTNGNPDALDPFFFGIFNAYGKPPTTTSTPPWPNNPYQAAGLAGKASGIGFRNPPYFGLLGGMVVFPTAGNHDIGTNPGVEEIYAGTHLLEDRSGNWPRCIRSFVLPPMRNPEFTAFNLETKDLGDCYGFRFGHVLFASLPVEKKESIFRSLNKFETQLSHCPHEWSMAFMHGFDHVYGRFSSGAVGAGDPARYCNKLVELGVDAVFMGHAHAFRHDNRSGAKLHVEGLRAIIAGTGGFGDYHSDAEHDIAYFFWHPFSDDPCLRPGFVLARVYGPVLEYWKIDTNPCGVDGFSDQSRAYLAPRVMEYTRIFKDPATGLHTTYEMLLNEPYLLGNASDAKRAQPFQSTPVVAGRWTDFDPSDNLVYLDRNWPPAAGKVVPAGFQPLEYVLRWRPNGDCWIHLLDTTTNWGKNFDYEKKPEDWCNPLFTVLQHGKLSTFLPYSSALLNSDTRLIYLGMPDEKKPFDRYLLLWDPRSGDYRVYRCFPEFSKTTGGPRPGNECKLLFELKFQGTWSKKTNDPIKAGHELVFLGKSKGGWYVLDWVPSDKNAYRIWRFHWDKNAGSNYNTPTGPIGDPLGASNMNTVQSPCASGVLGDFGCAPRIVGIFDKGHIVNVEGWSGRTRLHRRNFDIDKGMASFDVKGMDVRLSFLQDESSLVYLGQSRLLSREPQSGRYAIRRFQDGFMVDSDSI